MFVRTNLMIAILGRKYIVRILLMICSTLVWSQHTISGSILSTESKPIAYANILLLKANDSTFVNGTSSDDFGQFKIEDVATGTYILKTSYVGYNDNFKTVAISESQEIDNIILTESVERWKLYITSQL